MLINLNYDLQRLSNDRMRHQSGSSIAPDRRNNLNQCQSIKFWGKRDVTNGGSSFNLLETRRRSFNSKLRVLQNARHIYGTQPYAKPCPILRGNLCPVRREMHLGISKCTYVRILSKPSTSMDIVCTCIRLHAFRRVDLSIAEKGFHACLNALVPNPSMFLNNHNLL